MEWGPGRDTDPSANDSIRWFFSAETGHVFQDLGLIVDLDAIVESPTIGNSIDGLFLETCTLAARITKRALGNMTLSTTLSTKKTHWHFMTIRASLDLSPGPGYHMSMFGCESASRPVPAAELTLGQKPCRVCRFDERADQVVLHCRGCSLRFQLWVLSDGGLSRWVSDP
ncbi:hypothetical protein OQA88_8284 [Cercophora sp. LCS_1]